MSRRMSRIRQLPGSGSSEKALKEQKTEIKLKSITETETPVFSKFSGSLQIERVQTKSS